MPGKAASDDRMKLYLSHSIEELHEMAELPPSAKRSENATQLITSADKLYNAANDLLINGDQEKSYLSFVKYMNLVSHIRKTADYRKEEKRYKSLLVPSKVKSAIEKAERLQRELIRRYQDKSLEEETVNSLAKLEIKNTLEPGPAEKIEEESLPEPPPSDQAASLTTWQLESMINQQSTSFIIFDCRSKQDYNKSHINHPKCYSIPEEVIKPGISASTLYKELPTATRIVWNERLSVDVILLVDWFGTGDDPCQPMNLLKNIMMNWDPSSVYRGTIKYLDKGYDDLIMRFPRRVTDPLVLKPDQQASTALLATAIDFDYPDLDDEWPKAIPPAPASALPVVNRSTKPANETAPAPPSLTQSVTTVSDNNNSKEEKVADEVPLVNRQLKVQAVQKYDMDKELLLKTKEDLMDKSLDTAKQNLDQERAWERLHAEKSRRASGGDGDADDAEKMRQLKIREEQLLSHLKKLEGDNRQHEEEIARLRMTVSQYQKRDDLAALQADDVQTQNRIRDKEQERKRIFDDLHRLRQLRKEKELAEKATNGANKPANPSPKITGLRQSLQRDEQLKNLNVNRGTEKLKDDSVSGFGFGSKLNRSHSTPDLAQTLQNELKEPMPKVERSLKPQMNRTVQLNSRVEQVRNRNFDPVYGSRPGRALTGLKNLGNTCYMNSILQCMCRITTLTQFFTDGTFRRFLNRSNKGTRGEIAEEFASLLNAMCSGQYRSISCKDFKNAVGKYKAPFRRSDQQDSHEFLTILVDWLHEEMNETQVKTPLVEQNNFDIPDEKAATSAWDDYCRSNRSIIVSVFGGQQRSSLKCLSCGKESVTFEPFFNLSLPIPVSVDECSIMDCFQLYTKPELVSGWSCPFCKERREASKKIDIWKLPPVLVIHLQRFYNDGNWKKRFTTVDYSINEMNLENMVKSSNYKYSRFRLIAVSNHYGTMDGGHYTAYCKNEDLNKWFKFDDCNVVELTGNEVRSPNAYILFYSSL